MSTELENPKISESPSAVAAPPAKEVVTAKVWQRRRFQVGAGILAACAGWPPSERCSVPVAPPDPGAATSTIWRLHT